MIQRIDEAEKFHSICLVPTDSCRGFVGFLVPRRALVVRHHVGGRLGRYDDRAK